MKPMKEDIGEIPPNQLITDKDIVEIIDGKPHRFTFLDARENETRDWRKAACYEFDVLDEQGVVQASGWGILE